MKPSTLIKGGASLLAVIIILCILPFGWLNVKPTEVAVEVDKFAHKINPEPLGVGYHFFNRWSTDMVAYSVNARTFPAQSMATEGQSKEYNMDLKTNDGQNISLDLSLIYALASKEVPKLHATVGPNYEDQILLPQMRSEARLAIGQYTAEELYQGKIRDLIQQQVKEKLRSTLEQYPAIQVQDALIRHFSFSPQFENAIEQKKLAEQMVEVKKKQALAQEQEALRVEAEARGLKLKAVQEATGRAESMKVEADGERYKLEQEALGNLAKYKAEAEGKRLSAEALGGGQNVVALEFAKNIPDKLQIWGIPTGANSTSLMDLNGVFGKMLSKKQE